ncbi:MAG: glycosyltransferase family 2 protein [Clostridia bacterium]|nr:glycosyltransferase family 2 protein [Clostridia bacterium]
MKPILYFVIPCNNEETVLPVTAPLFVGKLTDLMHADMIHEDSRILFVDDGSTDRTWQIIRCLSEEYDVCEGISLSRNCGHQNALLAGLQTAMEKCDISISIDCDGQDDLDAIDRMIAAYLDGADVVYGVRDDRKTDSFWKRTTAQLFYRVMRGLGADVVYNHADFRLISAKVLRALSQYDEVNLFLRGLLPLVGFKSTCVYYSRKARVAGKTHYSVRKMVSFAMDGITSLSVRPIRLILLLGLIVATVSFIGIVWSMVDYFMGNTVAGWSSLVCIICFVSGVQCLCIGVIGEYIGKIYLETKRRPRYHIAEETSSDPADPTQKK